MTAPAPPPPQHLALAGLFPAADRAQWQELVAATLRKSGRIGADQAAATVEAVLSSTTYDGIQVLPLYTADDVLEVTAVDGIGAAVGLVAADGLPGEAPFVRGSTPDGSGPGGWDVRQRHAHPDPEVSREAVMADLENGVSSLWLVLGPAGLPLGSLAEVLRDVYLDLAPVVLDAGADTEAAAGELLALIAERGVSADAVRGNLGTDPIGLLARTGRIGSADGAGPGDGTGIEDGAGPADGGPDLGVVRRLAHRVLAEAPGLRAVTVDATVYHDAGGSDAEELGASLATGVAYLRALTEPGRGTADANVAGANESGPGAADVNGDDPGGTEVGLSVEQAFGQLEFRYAATADQFLTIAKFRAARRLWARVAEVCGVEPSEGQRQHAVTSSAMTSRRDPWVNLLRGTLACFGAGVGGAGAITVQPFDAAVGLPDAFSRRIARNTSSLLVMESHVARVIDPAGGSWYVERLTDELAAAAWDWFTEIERAGGIVAALGSGLVARRLEQTWARRADNLAHRRDPLTGVSEFPNLAETPLKRTPFPSDPVTGALLVHRYAEAYEALRDEADEHAERTGRRAAVFLATIGPPAAATARVGFAANLFQAGGLDTPTGSGGTDPEVIAKEFQAAGTTVACLASTDRIYAEHAAAVAQALITAGARSVWLAGTPGARAASDAEAGIDGYVYTGVNALEVLGAVHHQSGIPPAPDPGTTPDTAAGTPQ